MNFTITQEQVLRQEGVDEAAFLKAAKPDTVEKQIEATVTNLANNLPRHWREGLYVGHSGGKDSVLVNYLATEAFGQRTVLHTTKHGVTHPDTVEFLYSQPFPIIFCPAKCQDEYPELTTQIDGSRRAEFNRTDGRSTNIVVDGEDVSREHMTMFVRNGLFGLNFVYPIFDWTNEQVWAAICWKQLQVSKEYLV